MDGTAKQPEPQDDSERQKKTGRENSRDELLESKEARLERGRASLKKEQERQRQQQLRAERERRLELEGQRELGREMGVGSIGDARKQDLAAFRDWMKDQLERQDDSGKVACYIIKDAPNGWPHDFLVRPTPRSYWWEPTETICEEYVTELEHLRGFTESSIEKFRRVYAEFEKEHFGEASGKAS